MRAIFALCVFLISCNQWVRPNPPPPIRRTIEQQRAAAVGIRVQCNPFDDDAGTLASDRTGSGVMVSDWQILTAIHVVECSSLPKITVITEEGRWRMVVEREWRMTVIPNEEDGIVRLQLASADTLRPSLQPPRLTNDPPTLHDPLYIEGAMPAHSERIGEATGWEYGGASYGGYFFTYDATTEPGNSGSGVYDIGGDLVGIHLGHWRAGGLKYGAYATQEMIP